MMECTEAETSELEIVGGCSATCCRVSPCRQQADTVSTEQLQTLSHVFVVGEWVGPMLAQFQDIAQRKRPIRGNRLKNEPITGSQFDVVRA